MRKFIFCVMFIVLSFSSIVSNAQSTKLNFNGTIGYPIAFVFGGSQNFTISADLGVFRPLNDRFAVEGQVSFGKINYERSSAMFRHDGGATTYSNLVIGGRFYWNKQSAKHPFYSNIMVGVGAAKDSEYNADNVLRTDNYFSLSLETNTFVEINQRLMMGLTVESVGYFGFVGPKLGYVF